MDRDSSVVHKNYLTHLHLNCRGLRSRQDELANFLQESHTDVATLNETFLTANNRLYFPGYTLFRQDNTPHSGGVAILVRNSLRAQRQTIPNNPTNTLLVKLSFCNSPPIFIATYYSPPTAALDVDFLNHLATSYPRLVLAADLNAHHHKFGDRWKNTKGTMLHRLLTTSGLRLHRTPPTRQPTNPAHLPTSPDKLITSADITRRIHGIRPGPDVGSDHVPFLFTVAYGHVQYQSLEPRQVAVTDYYAADWPLFSHAVASLLSPLPAPLPHQTKLTHSTKQSQLP